MLDYLTGKHKAFVEEAVALKKQRKFEDALKAVNEALKIDEEFRIDKKYKEALCEKLEILNQLHHYEEAKTVQSKLRTLDNEDAEYYNSRGEHFLERNNPTSALEYFERALGSAPKTKDYWINKGTALLELDHYQEAHQTLDKAEAIDPNYATLWNRRGRIYDREKNYQKALESYEKAIGFTPENSSYWLNKGTTLRCMLSYEQAHQALQKALRLAPQDAEICYERGLVFINEKKYEEALCHLQEAIRLVPEDKDYRLKKVEVLYHLDRYQEALELDLNDAQINKKGIIFANEKKFEKALLCFKRAAELAPKNEDYQLNIAKALYSLSRYQEAHQALEPLKLDVHPLFSPFKDNEIKTKAEAWRLRGLIFSEQTEYEKALRCFKKAIQLIPKSKVYSYDIGEMLRNLNRFGEARQAFAEVVQIDPTHLSAWIHWGEICREQGDYDSALKCFTKASDLEPKNEVCWYEMGMMLKNLSRYKEAHRAFAEAIKLNPSYASAWIQNGEIYCEENNYADALNCFTHASEFKPENKHICSSKAIISYTFTLGRHQEAHLVLDEILKINKYEYRAKLFKGLVYLFQYDSTNQNVLDHAFQLLNEILAEKEIENSHLVLTFAGLGFISFLEKEYKAAERLFNEASQYAKAKEGIYHLGSELVRYQNHVKSSAQNIAFFEFSNESKTLISNSPFSIFSLILAFQCLQSLGALEDARFCLSEILRAVPQNEFALAQSKILEQKESEKDKQQQKSKQAMVLTKKGKKAIQDKLPDDQKQLLNIQQQLRSVGSKPFALLSFSFIYKLESWMHIIARANDTGTLSKVIQFVKERNSKWTFLLGGMLTALNHQNRTPYHLMSENLKKILSSESIKPIEYPDMIYQVLRSLIEDDNKDQNKKIIKFIKDAKEKQAQFDINHSDEEGKTLLHLAIQMRHISDKPLKKMVDLGADPEKSDKEGNCALHLAAKHNREDFILFLLKKHSHLVFQENQYGHTPLFCALMAQSIQAFTAILRYAQKQQKLWDIFSICDNNENTIFHVIAQVKSQSLLKNFLDILGDQDKPWVRSLLIKPNRDGVTGLKSIQSHPELNAILEKSFPAYEFDEDVTFSQAKKWLENNDESALKKEFKEQPELISALGVQRRTLLHHAVENKGKVDKDTIQMLLDMMPDISHQDANGDTVLHLAVRAGRDAVLKKIYKKASHLINVANNQGEIPLFDAARFDTSQSKTSVLETLFKLPKFPLQELVKHINKQGENIFHVIADLNHEKGLKQLLTHLIADRTTSKKEIAEFLFMPSNKQKSPIQLMQPALIKVVYATISIDVLYDGLSPKSFLCHLIHNPHLDFIPFPKDYDEDQKLQALKHMDSDADNAPLHIVVQKGMYEHITLLDKHVSKIIEKTKRYNERETWVNQFQKNSGDTALHIAIKNQDKKTTHALLEAGANIFAENKEKKTVFHLLQAQDKELGAILFDHCSKVVDARLSTILKERLKAANLEKYKSLLKHGISMPYEILINLCLVWLQQQPSYDGLKTLFECEADMTSALTNIADSLVSALETTLQGKDYLQTQQPVQQKTILAKEIFTLTKQTSMEDIPTLKSHLRTAYERALLKIFKLPQTQNESDPLATMAPQSTQQNEIFQARLFDHLYGAYYHARFIASGKLLSKKHLTSHEQRLSKVETLAEFTKIFCETANVENPWVSAGLTLVGSANFIATCFHDVRARIKQKSDINTSQNLVSSFQRTSVDPESADRIYQLVKWLTYRYEPLIKDIEKDADIRILADIIIERILNHLSRNRDILSHKENIFKRALHTIGLEKFLKQFNINFEKNTLMQRVLYGLHERVPAEKTQRITYKGNLVGVDDLLDKSALMIHKNEQTFYHVRKETNYKMYGAFNGVEEDFSIGKGFQRDQDITTKQLAEQTHIPASSTPSARSLQTQGIFKQANDNNNLPASLPKTKQKEYSP